MCLSFLLDHFATLHSLSWRENNASFSPSLDDISLTSTSSPYILALPITPWLTHQGTVAPSWPKADRLFHSLQGRPVNEVNLPYSLARGCHLRLHKTLLQKTTEQQNSGNHESVQHKLLSICSLYQHENMFHLSRCIMEFNLLIKDVKMYLKLTWLSENIHASSSQHLIECSSTTLNC